MGATTRGGPTAGPARAAVCVLLAVAGSLLALGAVLDLWLKTLNFGGSDTTSTNITAPQIAGHVLLAAAGVLLPVSAARALLGRVPRVAIAVAAAAGLLLALAVLGLST